MITDRDIAIRHVAERHGEGCRVEGHMSTGIATASPDDDVDEVMERMQREQVRRIPIVESGDRVVGIIAQADVATDVGPRKPEKVEQTLEEISKPARPSR